MNLGRNEHKKEATFDLTPLIDVVLLLIIFFMLTSQFSNTQRQPADLPRERGEEAPAEGDASVVLDIDAKGGVTMHGQKYAIAELDKFFASQARAADLEVVIRADRRATASSVNAIATGLMKAGIRKVKVATTSEGAPPVGGVPAPAAGGGAG